MNDSFDSSSKDAPPRMSPEALKKKKLWRNLFILNLCVTIFLIGLYWLPIKLEQMGGFLDSPSMKEKQTGGPSRKFGGAQSVAAVNPNLLPTSTIVIDATNEEQWTYFDFSRGKPVKIHDASSLEWDLAFRRGKIITNGGATNKFGKAGLIDLGEVRVWVASRDDLIAMKRRAGRPQALEDVRNLEAVARAMAAADDWGRSGSGVRAAARGPEAGVARAFLP